MNYYDKINWKNRSEGKTTKISAERLNHMDNQIFNNANAIGNVEKIADIGDGTLCGAAETLKETAEKLNQSLKSKSDTSHTHDGRYYTESEINAKIMSTSGIKKLNSSYGCSYYKNGNVVEVTVDFGAKTIPQAGVKLGTLPVSFRPSIGACEKISVN